MCSIMCYTGKDFTKEEMEAHLNRTKMRGPDASRMVETTFGYMGFARLSIMGLSEEGMQPFMKDGSISICNGEIYGFRRLKEELTAQGYSFVSGSDCEILLPMYEMYGLEMLKLNMNKYWDE